MYDDTALRRLLIELAASHPEHAAVIRAFTPLALARGKLLDAYALSRKTKPLDGFPMFRFEELPVCSEKSGAIASAVLEAVAEGFPGAREQVEAVRGALKPGSVRRLCKASLAHDPEPLALRGEKRPVAGCAGYGDRADGENPYGPHSEQPARSALRSGPEDLPILWRKTGTQRRP